SNQDVKFSIRPTGPSSVEIDTITVSGAGFSILSINSTLPNQATSALSLDFIVRFNAPIAAQFNASLQINGVAVTLLLATAVATPVLTAVTGCTLNSQNGFDFGGIVIGSQHLCNFSLLNATGQPMTIFNISLSPPFTFQQTPSTPVTLAPGTATAFAIEIAPVCGNLSIAGTLSIDSVAPQSIPLTATALTAPLPAASFHFDSHQFSSNQQHSLSISLASPLVCPAAGGIVTLAFTPNPNLPVDASVSFVSPFATSLSYTVAAGSAQVSINGQASVMFNTGTTAGSIAFSMTGGASTAISIPPATISIDSASASNQRLGNLDITVTAFDNTYSAGPMSFAFFDASGNQIGSAIAADFTSSFKTYFATQNSGSSFLMRVSFPVEGDQTKVATVKATFTNSAGQTQTGALTFQ
ncbi:MAG TPA: hypothetical protein VKS01_01640, partial [Bryobacteraceae bacterium]|nr:hypothetical protein [Bryobacteraceae bacterium]